ncbi:MAG: WYL domain-containing protein [Pseudomonadota bacterium]
MRDGALHRSADLARQFHVSQRTLFRDIDVLRASGLPIEGTRGLGYRLTAPITLPPLNLTLPELEALNLGLAVVSETTDPDLQAAARSLADKVDVALPNEITGAPEKLALSAYPFTDAQGHFRHLSVLRTAIKARQKLRLRANDGALLALRPLGLDYRGRVWILIAWLEEDADFRALRVDRIDTCEVLPELFTDEPGRTLADYHTGRHLRGPR